MLPIIGKIFEFLNFDRIKNYIEKFEILKANQFGFRSNHNTTDAIVSLLEDIRMNKQNNAIEIKVTFLDLKKAFDTVDHHILLQKCSDYGLRSKTLSIIASFLHDRTQVVKLKGKSSKSRQVSFGVPQGSILGPLLFILHINDISCNNENSTDYLFADDTAIKTIGTPKTIDSKHQLALNNVTHWLKQNKLTLNIKKTKTMSFRQKKASEDGFSLYAEKIENVNSFKYLGIILDHRLSFSEHSNIIQKKLNQFIAMFYRLRKFLKVSHMIRVYKTYVQPIIQYGVIAYGSTTKSILEPIDNKVNRLLRIIFIKKKFESTTKIREENNIYSTQELHIYELLKLLIKVIQKECNVEQLKKAIAEKELIEIDGMRKTKKKQLKVSYPKLSNCSITVRLRKLCNCLLGLDPTFFKSLRKRKKNRLKFSLQVSLKTMLLVL